MLLASTLMQRGRRSIAKVSLLWIIKGNIQRQTKHNSFLLFCSNGSSHTWVYSGANMASMIVSDYRTQVVCTVMPGSDILSTAIIPVWSGVIHAILHTQLCDLDLTSHLRPLCLMADNDCFPIAVSNCCFHVCHSYCLLLYNG